MKDSHMLLANEYGQFISRLCWPDLPTEAQEKTLDLMTDWMANTVAGFDSEIGQALFALDPVQNGETNSIVLGNLKKTHPLQAALINGGACHALEFDDTYRSGLYHPGAPVISAAWAAAGATPVSGRRFLSAVAAGYEISMRLADAVNPGHNATWHTTGTVGTFGAAAGAAHCMGLDPGKSAGALGLAGTQAAGLWEILPGFPQAKGLHTGKAAQSGLLAALLAGQGVLGPFSIFEGPRGFFKAMAPERIRRKICCAGLGEEWRLTRTTLKAYPVCGHTMTAIEAALNLAHENIDPKTIETIEVRAHPVSMGIAGNPAPANLLEAKFSIAFCVAVALVKKRVTLSDFSSDILSDPTVLSVLPKITLIRDDGLNRINGQRPAKVSIRFTDNRIRSETAHTRKGDPENPLTRLEIKNKFMELVRDAWGTEPGESVFNAVRLLPLYDDFNTWVKDHILIWKRDKPEHTTE